MLKPDHVIEIFLQPGDFYFGDVNTRIRTILGSCVSITMWHPTRLIGGMCHFLLPSRPKGAGLDGRYADEAMEMFMREIRAAKTHPAEYHVKVFGGGNMFRKTEKELAAQSDKFKSDSSFNMDVGGRNVIMARTLINVNGFKIKAEDLGGNGHRQLIFDIWNGHAWVRKPTAMSDVSP